MALNYIKVKLILQFGSESFVTSMKTSLCVTFSVCI